jgi:hypothetical protein
VRNPCRARAESEALKADAGRPHRKGGVPRKNVRRAWAPKGVPPRTGEALTGEAHGRSGASRAGRGRGGRRDGGSQTPDVARGGAGTHRSRQTGPRSSERVVGHESSGEEASSAARKVRGTVRGCSDSPLKGRESARGAPEGFGFPEVRPVSTRWTSKRRTGGAEPMTALDRPDRSPRSATRPHERALGPPRGEPGWSF